MERNKFMNENKEDEKMRINKNELLFGYCFEYIVKKHFSS
jgi:dihydroxyacetone kinase-like predicted kinase